MRVIRTTRIAVMEDVLLVAAFLTLVFALILSKAYFKWTTGWCNSDASMTGKTIIITGATSGIGKETAKDLARRGGRLILAVRSASGGEAVAREILREIPTAQVVVKNCDLSSLKSVRSFAEDIMSSEERIDVLILNAGMVPPPGKFLTEDSLELQFASNHLGHFLVTNLLLDRLIESAPSRIVIVSSLLHSCGSIDFGNLSFEEYTPDPFYTYSNSKLANLLMCKELARRLAGTAVTANALHPGLVRTCINRQTPWYVKNFMQPISYFWAKSPIEGAQTSIFLAVHPKLRDVSGKYFADCKETACSAKADDPQLAARLWSVSQDLTSQTRSSSS